MESLLSLEEYMQSEHYCKAGGQDKSGQEGAGLAQWVAESVTALEHSC